MTPDLIQRLRGPFPSTTSTEVLWLLSEAIDALFSAAEENARAGWRPIESAPKDERVLVLLANGDWTFASYYTPSKRWSASALSNALHVTHWLPKPALPPSPGDNNG